MKRLIICFTVIGFILCGCGLSNSTRELNLSGSQKPALRQIDHKNSKIKMEVIDEIPSLGIIVIRFIDAGHTRYIAVKKESISVSSQYGGKQTAYEEIETIN